VRNEDKRAGGQMDGRVEDDVHDSYDNLLGSIAHQGLAFGDGVHETVGFDVFDKIGEVGCFGDSLQV
jgi:hypothetical protein